MCIYILKKSSHCLAKIQDIPTIVYNIPKFALCNMIQISKSSDGNSLLTFVKVGSVYGMPSKGPAKAVAYLKLITYHDHALTCSRY